jgi:DNA-binding transcriptional MerR regulator
MLELENQLLVHELAERAGVSVRTIRYYIAEGLLPAPTTRGRYAYYSEEYLDLIELIRRLKDAYLPLREIRSLVLNLPPEIVRQVLEKNAGLPQEELLKNIRQLAEYYQQEEETSNRYLDDTATSYADKLLKIQDAPAPFSSKLKQSTDLLSRPRELQRSDKRKIIESSDAIDNDISSDPFDEDFSKTTWVKIEITPGIEIHLSSIKYHRFKDRIKKLVLLARDLFL